MRIAVYGKLRAGKTAVCDYITEKFDCEILECSGALQEIVDILYPDKKGIKDRELLVTIGQHLRKIDEDIWVNLLEHKINDSMLNLSPFSIHLSILVLKMVINLALSH